MPQDDELLEKVYAQSMVHEVMEKQKKQTEEVSITIVLLLIIFILRIMLMNRLYLGFFRICRLVE